MTAVYNLGLKVNTSSISVKMFTLNFLIIIPGEYTNSESCKCINKLYLYFCLSSSCCQLVACSCIFTLGLLVGLICLLFLAVNYWCKAVILAHSDQPPLLNEDELCYKAGDKEVLLSADASYALIYRLFTPDGCLPHNKHVTACR